MRQLLLVVTALMVAISSMSVSAEEEKEQEIVGYMDLLEKGDEAGAFKLVMKMALLCDPKAQSNLGVMYERGLGTEVDLEMAYLLFRISSDLGTPYSHCNLAEMYEHGRYVEQDLQRAMTLYEMALGSKDADEKVRIASMAAIVRIQSLQRDEQDVLVSPSPNVTNRI